MRQYISLILFVLSCSFSFAGKQEYADNSVLSENKWYKIGVKESGLYKLTYSDIKSMGIGDPAGVRIYGYGGAIIEEDLSKLLPRHDDLPEIAIYMEKGADGVFSDGDYILFYAQGTISDNIGKPTSFGQINTLHSYTYNYYSDMGYYFVTCKPGEGKRITEETALTEQANVEFTSTYAGRYIHKSEYNLAESGREWYGYKFQGNTKTQSFVINDTDIDTSEVLYLDVCVVASAKSQTTFNVSLNGEDIGQRISVGGSTSTSQMGQKGIMKTYLGNTVASNPTITLRYNSVTSSDIGYLYYLTANYYKNMVLSGNGGSLLITNPYEIKSDAIASYTIQGCTGSTKVWNITDPINISSMPYELRSDIAVFKAKHDKFHKFFAFNSSSAAAKPPTRSSMAA